MSGFALHPEALNDLNDIGEHIAASNPDAADRMMTEIFSHFAPVCGSSQEDQRGASE